jgi:hypothetical protein
MYRATGSAVHRTSYRSKATTYLYKAYDRDTGQFLKWGITSNLKTRYPQKDKLILQVKPQGTRRQMAALERRVVSRFGRPLNREPWSRYNRAG